MIGRRGPAMSANAPVSLAAVTVALVLVAVVAAGVAAAVVATASASPAVAAGSTADGVAYPERSAADGVAYPERSTMGDATSPERSAASSGPALPALESNAMHGVHIEVDSQATSDGTVVVEQLSMLRYGYVVLRADDGGSPGAPVGYAPVRGVGDQSAVSVRVDADTWDGWSGNRTLWAVLHRDDGDGEFDPDADPALSDRNPLASASFTLRKHADDVRVLATDIDPQRLDGATLTVPRVDLAAPGHVVVRSVDGTTTIGSARATAGSHENVSVQLNRSFVAAQAERFRVRAVAYRDDGDGEFGDGDVPVRAGTDLVGTLLTVEKAEGFDATEDAPSTEVTDGAGSGESTTSASNAGGDVRSKAGEDAGSETATKAAGGSGPGFGAIPTLAAVALGAVLVAVANRRTRRR